MKKYIQKQVIKEINKSSKVLDLGCGDGRLLEFLVNKKKVNAYGIDIKFDNIISCTQKGLSVFHGDLNEGLPGFSDNSFDTVILSQTLQQVQDPQLLLNEMLRVGKKGIVTFPNFAHYTVRFNLMFKGKAPKTKQLPYEWYDTPNIRVLSIKNFKELCKKLDIKIEKEIPIFSNMLERILLPNRLTNLLAREGMFVISKSTQ